VEQQQLLEVFDLGEIIVTRLIAAQRTDAESGGRGGRGGSRRSTVGHAGIHMIEVTWKTMDTGGSGVATGTLAVAVHFLELLVACAGATTAAGVVIVTIGTAPDAAHRHHRGGRIAAGVCGSRCHHSRRY